MQRTESIHSNLPQTWREWQGQKTIQVQIMGVTFTGTGMQNKREEERNISKIGTWIWFKRDSVRVSYHKRDSWCYHKRDSVRVSWVLEISRCAHSLALMGHAPWPSLSCLEEWLYLKPCKIVSRIFWSQTNGQEIFIFWFSGAFGNLVLSKISSNSFFPGKPFLTSWVAPVLPQTLPPPMGCRSIPPPHVSINSLN